MASKGPGEPQIRAFVALDLPEQLREGAVAWGKRELTDPALRVVPAPNLHLTLVFLGAMTEERVARVAETLNQLDPAPLQLELERFAVGRGRSRNRPSVLALPVRSEGAVALQAELERRLVAERLYKREKRRFWPHLTVARVRPESPGSRKPARIERMPGPLPAGLRTPVRVVRLTFYRSKTRPEGAEYIPLAQHELPDR